jgi:hypothetical protein
VDSEVDEGALPRLELAPEAVSPPIEALEAEEEPEGEEEEVLGEVTVVDTVATMLVLQMRCLVRLPPLLLQASKS